MLNAQRRTTNTEHRTTNNEHPTSNAEPAYALGWAPSWRALNALNVREQRTEKQRAEAAFCALQKGF
jgi:hypothetical protein